MTKKLKGALSAKTVVDECFQMLSESNALTTRPSATDGILRQDFSGKNDNLRARREPGGKKEVEWEGQQTLKTEMTDPFSRKKLDPARRFTRYKSLFISIFLGYTRGIGGELGLNRNELTNRKTINGCLPQTLERLCRISCQDHVLGITECEESVQRVRYNQIQIQKEHDPR